MYNPYMPFNNIVSMPAPQMEIPKVNGEESARAYNMGPNSSVILLDIENPLIWVVTTDSSGFKTVQPYTIAPYTPEKPFRASDIKTQLGEINDRLAKLEERMNNHGQSNHGNAWRNKKQQFTRSGGATDENDIQSQGGN